MPYTVPESEPKASAFAALLARITATQGANATNASAENPAGVCASASTLALASATSSCESERTREDAIMPSAYH